MPKASGAVFDCIPQYAPKHIQSEATIRFIAAFSVQLRGPASRDTAIGATKHADVSCRSQRRSRSRKNVVPPALFGRNHRRPRWLRADLRVPRCYDLSYARHRGSLPVPTLTPAPEHATRSNFVRAGGCMDWTDRRERMRAIVNGGRCIYPGSVYDPISARIAEDLGFEAGMFAGSVCLARGARRARHRRADLERIRRAGLSDQPRRPRMPLLVDADHGYGNALNVKRTVEELETAGVAGADHRGYELPMAYGESGPKLISIAEGVGKMRAAIAGRQDPRLIIVGRTSALSITGMEDTIARLQGLRGGRRRHAVHDRREDARAARCGLGGGEAAAVSRRRAATSSTISTISAPATSASACRRTRRSWRPCRRPTRR